MPHNEVSAILIILIPAHLLDALFIYQGGACIWGGNSLFVMFLRPFPGENMTSAQRLSQGFTAGPTVT